MSAPLIACLIAAPLALTIWWSRLRPVPQGHELRERIVDAISGRAGGALILIETDGIDTAGLSRALLRPADELLIGADNLAVILASPGRDAEFARWLCRAQMLFEDKGVKVRMGATRIGPGARPEQHLFRAERALARAKAEGSAFVIDDQALPRVLSNEAAAIPFDAMPILCSERQTIVAVEPVAPPEIESRVPASSEAARHLFLARLRSGARMLSRLEASEARLILEVPHSIANDPDLPLALALGLDGCDVPPERVTLRIEAGLPAETRHALKGTGCCLSTEAAAPAEVETGPHWLSAALVRDMEHDDTARARAGEILARASITGAEILATGIASRKTAHILTSLGCNLLSGPGVSAALPEPGQPAVRHGEDRSGRASSG